VIFRGLKAQLTVNLAFFLLFAVLLTDFVVIRIIEEKLLQERIQQSREFLKEIGGGIFEKHSSGKMKAGAVKNPLNAGHPWIVFGLFSTTAGENMRFGCMPPDTVWDIEQANKAVFASGENQQRFFLGDTWGVFWKQAKYVVISEPFSASRPTGAATLVVRLDDIYAHLRQSQKIIFYYCLANLFILLFIGMLRMNRIVIRPIRRFIRLTDDLRSTDQFPSYPGKRNSEFGQLSNAIHRMARRIEKDKERIESSLHSLEKVHADLKNTQQEMIRAEKLASIGRLSAGIAHEIGNPVGVVLGYLGLLKRQPAFKENPTGQEYIERAESEINRINTIIRQLLDFSRSSASERQVVFVHALLKDVRQMFSHQPLMGKISLKTDLSAENNRVYADYQQLRQVLINLLINAADSISVSSNSDNGEIWLQTRDIPKTDENAMNQSPNIELTVSDNGTGIAREEIDNIFDPFYTTKEPGKGTGLGLSVSYMIIEQFGGAIRVNSTVNQGTALSIYLPAATT